jgi:kelch-like protein 12
LGIKAFAELHNCINLKNATQEYIYEHFSQVVQNSDEFYNLKSNELEDLIKSNEIEVPNEEVVYNCVFNWINFDKKNREQHLPKLMIHVKLPLLSPQFLTDVCDKENMIKRSFECRDMLDEAKKFYLRPDCRAEMSGERFQIRTGKDENLVMLGGFGFQQKPLDVVELYNPRTNQWSTLPSLTKKRRYAASAAIGKCLYVIGGYDTKTRLKSVEKLDLSEANPQWQSVSSLLFRRALPAVCVHDNKIYVCGGFDGTSRHSTMEYYDHVNDKWTLLDSTSVGREGAGLVSLGDSLYCIGGYDGFNLLRSVERYDLHTSTWSLIASMLTPRSGNSFFLLVNSN